MSASGHGALRTANRQLLKRLLVVAGIMFGFGFALVPFYNKICQVTGLKSILQADHVNTVQTPIDMSRAVTVQFDTNIHGMSWNFRPLAPHLLVHPGELAQAVFEVRNNDRRPVMGQAIPSYSPAFAAAYFKKVDCFCFTQQSLRPGESRQMPVIFTVDPSLPKSVEVITLSFTFFEVNGASAGVGPAPATPDPGAVGSPPRPAAAAAVLSPARPGTL
jgi:cytochrome c oxidase assembly protein subunit 11